MARNKMNVVGLFASLAVVTACPAGGERIAEDTDDGDGGPASATVGDPGTDPSGAGDTEGDPETQGDSDGDSDSGATTGDDDGSTGADSDGGDTTADEPAPGLVMVLGNEDGQNEVVAFARASDGSLSPLGSFATGGMGTGAGLGSQGAMAVSDDRQYVYVVNPGDDSVSSLRIHQGDGDDHLALVDIVPSEGVHPTSLTLAGDHLYVLNADGAGSVVGFALDEGRMDLLGDGTQPLSGDLAPAPAQVAASPDGSHLIVTERATNQILTYQVGTDGSLSAPVINPSEGETPFGLDFTSTGVFVVSEAFGGGMNPGASAASSYRVADGGGLWTFNASVPSGQTAACWALVVRDEFVYTTNTGSNTLSGYNLDDQGGLELFVGDGALIDLGEEQGPIDMAKNEGEDYVYALNARADTIVAFAVDEAGMLTEIGDRTAVPETAVGLAAF